MKLYTSLLREYEQGSPDSQSGNNRPVTWQELSQLRNHLDELWKKLGVDITFTHHFFDRVNDPRNRKQITIGELSKLFSDTYSKHGQNISVRVKPGSDHEFEAVITDLTTKVNLPFVLEWDRQRRELRLVAKTVMRKNDFKTPDPRFVVQNFEPKGTVITEKKMKTYRDIKEWVGWDTPEVAPIATPQAVDDVDSAAFSVEKPEILEKLNAYCHDIANHQYINPYYPLNTLWKKLMLIGLQFDLKKILMTGEQGRVEVPIIQYGGRYGVLGDPSSFVSKDDGTRVAGGLNLVVTYQKTGGVYTLDAHIQRGYVPMAVGFGEEAEINEARATKAHIFHHLTRHGFEYSPDEMGNDSYHHKSGHSFYVGKNGDNFWHEHNGVEKGSGGAFPGHKIYDSALASAKRLTDSIRANEKSHPAEKKDAKKKDVKEAAEFHSTGSYTNHPFHKVLTKHGYEHESSHDQDPRGRVHTYFHPKSQHVISIGSVRGKAAWGSEQATGGDAKGLAQHIKDVNSLSPEAAKKWRIARPTVKKK